MAFKYKLTKKVEEFLDNSEYEEINIGYSNTQVFHIIKNKEDYFLKVGKKEYLNDEYSKLKYLQDKLPVPKITFREIYDDIEYLITTKIPGEMVCSDYYMKHQSEGIDIIVEAFKLLYNVDICNCPINVSLDYKLSIAESNIRKGLIKDENIDEKELERFGSAQGVLDYLKKNKFAEDLCFSHWDISLPNIFADDGKFSGFIDVGDCGIADRWFDIAIVIRSIIRNFGEEYVQEFLDKLGFDYDKFKFDYYMLLMQLYL